MATIRIDANFADSPQAIYVGPLAAWLHICALCYCSRHQTGGFMSESAVLQLTDLDGILDWGEEEADALDLAGRLVRVGLWQKVEGGYQCLG